MRIMWEPGCGVLGVAVLPKVTAAHTEDGESLALSAENPRSRYIQSTWGGCIQHHSRAELKAPSDAGGLLAALEGTLTFIVAGKEDQAVFEDILNGKGAVAIAGDVEVRVDSIKTTNRDCVIVATTTKPKERRSDDQRVYRRGTFTLLDETGNKLRRRSMSPRAKENATSYTLCFHTKGRAPAKLIFRWPSELREEEVEFRFENLPLP